MKRRQTEYNSPRSGLQFELLYPKEGGRPLSVHLMKQNEGELIRAIEFRIIESNDKTKDSN